MQIGDTVKLIRKITGEVLPVQLGGVLTRSPKPAVEVYWKTERRRYKLDLDKDIVHAIDATESHRQAMKAWYSVDAEDRIALTKLFWDMRKQRRK